MQYNSEVFKKFSPTIVTIVPPSGSPHKGEKPDIRGSSATINSYLKHLLTIDEIGKWPYSGFREINIAQRTSVRINPDLNLCGAQDLGQEPSRTEHARRIV